jgi:hypothetical protein
MQTKIILLSILLFSTTVYSQDSRIILSEKKTGKRTVLVAENKTQDTLNVFLMVISEGYRRSADRPIIKNIPPLTNVPMITLIELANEPSSYTYEIIINDQERDLNFTLENKEKDIENVIRGRLVLFIMSGCEKCELLSSELRKKDIAHRVFNISDDPLLYKQFMAFINDELTKETRIKFPVIWNKDYTIFGFNTIEDILKELQQPTPRD